jgi:acetylornithine deacetylase/succinyl-diaminopimelate desuccinylase-like protein
MYWRPFKSTMASAAAAPLTADEESGSSNGVDWLLKNHRDLIDAQFVLNHDGNAITCDRGKPRSSRSIAATSSSTVI